MKAASLDQSKSRAIGRRAVTLSVSIVVIGLGLLYTYNLDGWLINDDEGSFLYQVWRITEGEKPYQDFFTSRWPLFLYTGAGWMRIAGAGALSMRALCVGFTLGTAVLTFLLARETLSAEAALLAMFIFLTNPHVFQFGRYFQPEAFYVFFSVLGLYLFSLATRRADPALFAAASLALAVGSLYKLLTILTVGGCSLHLLVRWLRKPDCRRRVMVEALVFWTSYGLIFGLTTVFVMGRFAAFSKSVIELNLTQGGETSLSQSVIKGIIFLLSYSFRSAPFLLLAMPAALRGWSGSRGTQLVSWQLPTALAFTLLSRQLFPRLLLYLIPSLSILVAASLEPVRRLGNPSLLLLAIVGGLLAPWMATDAQFLLRQEPDTARISEWIQARTTPDTRIFSDYQELNFYSRRPSTPLGAEISYVVLDSGQIASQDLIADIEKNQAQMVILDVSPVTGHQLISMSGYRQFRRYLEENFSLLNVVPRAQQELEIHVRSERRTNTIY